MSDGGRGQSLCMLCGAPPEGRCPESDNTLHALPVPPPVGLSSEADEYKRCPMCDHRWSEHTDKCESPYCSCPEGVQRVWARPTDDASDST